MQMLNERCRAWPMFTALLSCFLLSACTFGPFTRSPAGHFDPAAVWSDDGDEEEGGGGPPIFVQVLMWTPNRILDALEIVRFGVGVGPGVGVDLRLTELGQASAMFGTGVGLGWQGRWSSPLLIDVWSFVAAGPVTVGATGANPVLEWPRTFFEIRASAHAALVFAEVAVDLAEIYDFLAGILFFDPMEDDILGPHWI